HPPDRPDRAVRRMRAQPDGAGVPLAEPRVVEATAEGGQRLSHVDLLGRARERVAALLAARAAHEAGPAEDPHHLGDGGGGDGLLPAPLRDGQALARPLAPEAQETPKPVLLLSGHLHERDPFDNSGEYSSRTPPPAPSATPHPARGGVNPPLATRPL